MTETMDASEYADESELADAMNPDIGSGTPGTAPFEALLNDPEDAVDVEDERGAADDGDDENVEHDDEDGPIEETI